MGIFGFLSSKQKEPSPHTHVDRVHLIVHPGDGLCREENIPSEQHLLQAITTRAISLKQRNEIQVILLQMSSEEWDRTRDPAYTGKEKILAETVRKIVAANPDNVIVAPDAPTVAYPFLDRAFDRVRQKCEERGLVIDSKTKLEAIGERVDKCVPEATKYFARYFELKERPIIDLNYTDVSVRGIPALWKRGGAALSFAESINGATLQYIPLREIAEER